MSDISYKYLRSLTGPQLQVTGTNITRYPTLNIGDGIGVTEDVVNRRHTLSVDSGSIVQDAVTASVNAVGALPFVTFGSDSTLSNERVLTSPFPLTSSYDATNFTVAMDAAFSSSIATVSKSFTAVSKSFDVLSSSYVVLSGAHSRVSNSFVIVSSSYVALSNSYTKVSQSFVLVSGSYLTLSSSYTKVSQSFALVSSSYISLSRAYASYEFTGSIYAAGPPTPGTVIKTSAVPKYSQAGLIPAVSQIDFEIQLTTNGVDPYIDWNVAGHIMNSGSTIWRQVQFGFIDNKPAAASMVYTGSQGSFFTGISCSMSTSIAAATNIMTVHLVNSRSSEYSYAINLGMSSLSASSQ